MPSVQHALGPSMIPLFTEGVQAFPQSGRSYQEILSIAPLGVANLLTGILCRTWKTRCPTIAMRHVNSMLTVLMFR